LEKQSVTGQKYPEFLLGSFKKHQCNEVGVGEGSVTNYHSALLLLVYITPRQEFDWKDGYKVYIKDFSPHMTLSTI